jgi:hydrogenase-4 membrane subunit HyfE
VSGTLAWALVALGIAVVVVRRRSVAVGLVTAQALLLAGVATAEAESGDDVAAALALAVRGVALAALFLAMVARTREPRPVRAGVAPFARAGLAIVLALAFVWLVPPVGLESEQSERAMLTLVAFGAAVVATRRATLHQLLGIVMVENGLVLGAIELPGGASLAIELGVALDLTFIAVVAVVFHERIFAEFGSGDTAVLESLRD